ncbi:MAG: Crp/Fnr family transcriptional regulator [Gammaproteobacteria bacterium]|nr:Crp/Fnr family transcriptional regulator [Gammaproteobacteria bacterium]
MEINKLLGNVPLFSDLPEADIQAISSLAATRTYHRNTIIISEGDHSDSMYVILSGKVKILLSDDEGKEIIINIQGNGEYFGELALLDDAPRSATVMTIEECRLVVVSKSAFEDCLAKNAELALRVIRGLSSRLRGLTENVKSLALMDVYGRVARTLLELAKPISEGLIIDQKLTQRDIACMVGASREMVSRILKDLSKGGYITINHKNIIIHDKLPPGW